MEHQDAGRRPNVFGFLSFMLVFFVFWFFGFQFFGFLVFRFFGFSILCVSWFFDLFLVFRVFKKITFVLKIALNDVLRLDS